MGKGGSTYPEGAPKEGKMKVRVVKEGRGRVSLLVISEGRPPIPPVAVRNLKVVDVHKECTKVLEVIGRARSWAVAESTPQPG